MLHKPRNHVSVCREYAKAKEYLQKALTINTEIGAKRGEATCYGNLGRCFGMSENKPRLKNNFRKHLPSRQKLATNTEKRHATQA